MQFLYVFWGKVIQGQKRGRILGFPTANISLHKKIPEGIYISLTRVENKWYPSITFIGSAKTFLETTYKSETFLLHFHRSIYGKWITIKCIKKIRGNKKFSSAKLLKQQMISDLAEANAYFTKKDEEIITGNP